jgi:hypothetical protein
MEAIRQFDICEWSATPSGSQCSEALSALEAGSVLFFPNLPFELTQEERVLLSPALLNGHKNVSMNPNGKLKHAKIAQSERPHLESMMQRFADNASTLIANLLPDYANRMERARTSYRPAEIAGRKYSPLTDDTRLHVDAFPTRPMKRGRRILRLFSNINPDGAPRIWHVGEPFEDMAKTLLPGLPAATPAKDLLLAMFFITRGKRSPYDGYMKGLHDGAKLNGAYQKNSPQIEFAFPAGCTWLCYTDQVIHAALSGQYALEQTFHLDLDAMVYPERAPFNVLERMTGRSLA